MKGLDEAVKDWARCFSDLVYPILNWMGTKINRSVCHLRTGNNSCIIVGYIQTLIMLPSYSWQLTKHDYFYCLTLSQTNPEALVFMCLQYMPFKTQWEKEKLLITSNFSFSHSVFSTHLEKFLPLSSSLKCSLQTLWVWKSLKFVVWERVKWHWVGLSWQK